MVGSPEPTRPSYVRELRHDFRTIYHVSYDEVPVEEACDLISTLPDGSAYLAAINPKRSWSVEENQLAAIHDAIWAFLWMRSDAGTTKGAPRMQRPWDSWEQEQAVERSRETRRRLEDVTWKDVENG